MVFIDLRYLLIPLITLVLLPFTSQGQGVTPFSLVLASIQFNDQYPILKFVSLLLVIFLVLLFLSTRIELHLNADANITVRYGYSTGPLALLMLASIFLSPPLFFCAYFLIIITFPCHGMLWDSLKGFFNRFMLSLRALPPLVISCAQQQSDNPEAAQLPGFSVDSVDIEAQGNPMQNLHSL